MDVEKYIKCSSDPELHLNRPSIYLQNCLYLDSGNLQDLSLRSLIAPASCNMFLNLVIFVAGVVAFTIPEGQADGVYQVSYDASGTEIHTLISYDDTASGLESSAKFDKRSFTSGAASKSDHTVGYEYSTGLRR